MATTKPRLTITLEPHTYEVISQLADLQGRPKAKIITELLDSVTPVLERTCYVLEMAHRATSGVSDDLRDSMERSEAKLKAMMEDAMGQMDIFAEGLSALSESGDEAERKAGFAASPGSRSETTQPPHSNTGVTFGDNSINPKKNRH